MPAYTMKMPIYAMQAPPYATPMPCLRYYPVAEMPSMTILMPQTAKCRHLKVLAVVAQARQKAAVLWRWDGVEASLSCAERL